MGNYQQSLPENTKRRENLLFYVAGITLIPKPKVSTTKDHFSSKPSWIHIQTSLTKQNLARFLKNNCTLQWTDLFQGYKTWSIFEKTMCCQCKNSFKLKGNTRYLF